MAALNERERRYWTIVIFGFIGVTAAGFQLRGALLPSLQQSFAVSESLLGLVATAGTAGFVCLVLVTGMVAGRIDIGRALRLSVVLVGVSMAGMAFAPSYGAYLAVLLTRGVATGPFRALDRALLSHLYPDGRGRIFNYYALVWALGAAAGPLIVTGALAVGSWRVAYLALAVAFLPVVVLVWRLDLPAAVTSERPLTAARLRSLLDRPAVSGMGAALVLSGGVEGTLFTWLPYFAAQMFDSGGANLVLTTYLLAYIPGRLLYGRVVDRLRSGVDLVLALSVCAVPLYYLAVYEVRGWPLFVVVGLLGFVISGIFPTLSAFGVDAAPEYSGPVNAIATSASYVGIAVVPPLVGVLIGSVGIDRALALPLSLLCAFAVVVYATRRSIAAPVAPVRETN